MNVVDKALRKAKKEGKTVMVVAKAVGVSRTTVTTWRQQGYVTEDYVMKFSDVVGVPPWMISKLTKDMVERLNVQ